MSAHVLHTSIAERYQHMLPSRSDLYLLVEPGRITYLVIDDQQKVIRLGDAPGEIDDKDFGAPILRLVTKVIEEADLLQDWRSVFLCWSSMEAAMVPNRLYMPDRAAEYLSRLTNLHPEAEIFTDAWQTPGVHVVYSIWSDLLHGIRHMFPYVEVCHHHSLLVQTWLRDLTAQSEQQVFLHVLTKRIVLAHFEGNNLLFINQYHIDHATDCLYFTMLVYNQFHLDVRKVPLHVSGRIAEESAAFTELSRFVANVDLHLPKQQVDTDLLPDKPDNSLYFDLLSFPIYKHT